MGFTALPSELQGCTANIAWMNPVWSQETAVETCLAWLYYKQGEDKDSGVETLKPLISLFLAK